MALRDWLSGGDAPWATILIRLVVGGVFLAEGIQKFLFPAALGVGRFEKIGIPAPGFTAPFVGAVEIVFGALLIAGFLTRRGGDTAHHRHQRGDRHHQDSVGSPERLLGRRS